MQRVYSRNSLNSISFNAANLVYTINRVVGDRLIPTVFFREFPGFSGRDNELAAIAVIMVGIERCYVYCISM
jgi:hypothetical protein